MPFAFVSFLLFFDVGVIRVELTFSNSGNVIWLRSGVNSSGSSLCFLLIHVKELQFS